MGKFTEDLSSRMRDWQEGRNGVDELCRFVVVVAIIILVIALFVFTGPLLVLALILLGYGYFRAYSKNHVQRRKENEAYLNMREKLTGGKGFGKAEREKRKNINEQKKRYAATHKFYKCKQCKHELMVPKGKGKIRVTCPHCGSKFDANT